MMRKPKKKTEKQHLEDDAGSVRNQLLNLNEEVSRLAAELAELRSHLNSRIRTIERTASDSQSARQLAIDVAKTLELSLIDLNALRRDVDALREPNP